jgi:hypothetical protein
MKNHSTFHSENLTRRDKTIILKWKFDKQGVWEWSEFHLLIIKVLDPMNMVVTNFHIL